jgi:outer membrane protein OmpA-like peptidoglycan-associated protein
MKFFLSIFGLVSRTKFLFLFFIFHLFMFGLSADEVVLRGTMISGGMYFEAEGGSIYPIKANFLSSELMDMLGRKIRLLCEIEGEYCSPRRYEIEPFADTEGLKDWTLKPIPKYVYRGLNSFNPTVTPDGNKLYWTVVSSQGGNSTQKIWYTEKDRFGLWKRGVQLGSPLNNDTPSAVISALPGGNELFVFGSFQENEMFMELKNKYNDQKQSLVKTAKSMSDLKIKYLSLKEDYKKELEKIQNRVPLYKTQKTTEGWSRPEPIDFPDFYNLYKSEENPMHQVFGGSSLSSTGRVLIYSAKHKDSYGKLDLYVSELGSDGKFQLGRNLGATINSSEEEMAPFLASDGRTLYFSSNGHNGLSIYYTKRSGEGWESWSKPVEISKNLKDVNFFSIPASGNWAYVSKKGQLMMAYLPNELKPNAVILVKGKVVDDRGNPLSAEVHYESLITYQKKGDTVSNPDTGEFNLILPYGEKYGFHADKKGYLPVHKNLDIREDASKYKEIEVLIVLPKVEVGKEITINNLFFDSGKYTISNGSELELDRLGQIMKDNSTVKVRIEGHTDNTGEKSENLALSVARAKEVAAYLKKKYGFADDRFQVIGKGPDEPIVANDTPENRQKNRRVVFKIVE